MRTNQRIVIPLVFLALPLCGCTHFLSTVMVSAPNRLDPIDTDWNPVPKPWGVDQELRIPVGPPAAELSVSIIEPDDEPHGTVLVLHGIWASSVWMQRAAHDLAESGFRAVLVDLRGHGHSSGAWLTFGQQESRDLVQVIDELEGRGLIAGEIGVYGISYGAATSIQLSGLDPRIKAVVAVAPFSTMREVVPDYARTVLPGIERGLSDAELQQAVDSAGLRGNFDPDLSDTVAAITRTAAPVLLLHGADDWLVPCDHSRRLHAAAPDHSRLLILPDTGHNSIWFDTDHVVAEQSLAWFEQWLNEETPGIAKVRAAGLDRSN